MVNGGVIVEEPISSGLQAGSAPSSPKNKIKFLCSHGGKILPRPSDGHLKYVGGETRVISVPRDIKFPELMKKLTPQIEGDMVLKYQLVPEDLDALISVKSDEDLRHMLDEYDRCESAGIPRLRAFLFPAKPVVMDSHTAPSEPLEQRYIDAINGIVRAREAGMKLQAQPPQRQASFAISSACSSPRSPESYNPEGAIQESVLQSMRQNRSQLHKVHSSPSIFTLASQPQPQPQPQQQSFHHIPQLLQQYQHQHQHHYQNNRQQPMYNGFHLSKPPPAEPLKGPERLVSVRSVGRAEGVRYQVVDHGQNYYQPTIRHGRGSGCCMKCMQYDDCGHWGDRRTGTRSPSSLSPSPIPLSPRYSQTKTAMGGLEE